MCACVCACVCLCVCVMLFLGGESLADTPCFCARHFSNQRRSLELDGCSLSLFNREKMSRLRPLFSTELHHFTQRWGLFHNHFIMDPKEISISCVYATKGWAAYCVTLSVAVSISSLRLWPSLTFTVIAAVFFHSLCHRKHSY